jgi:hypothetical protein
MRRRWLTAILVVTLLASSWAAFGPWEMAAAAYLLGISAVARAWWRGSKEAGGVLVLLLLLPLLGFIFLPAVQPAREAARRISCGNRLKQVGIALLTYEEKNGCLPPAYVCDKDGKPMHSWRVLILPSLEMEGLYGMYHFDEPWDGPNNRRLAENMPENFSCPIANAAGANLRPMTSYVVVTGDDTMFPGCQSRRLKDITARASETVMLVEVTNSDIHWMEPRDPSIDDLASTSSVCRPFSSHHAPTLDYWRYAQPGGNVVCADGSVHYLPAGISADDAKVLLSIHGNKSETIAELERRPGLSAGLRWNHVVGLPLFCLSLVGLSWLALTARRPPRSQGASGAAE